MNRISTPSQRHFNAALTPFQAIDVQDFRKMLEQGGFEASRDEWTATLQALDALSKGDIELGKLQAALTSRKSTLDWELSKSEKGPLAPRSPVSPATSSATSSLVFPHRPKRSKEDPERAAGMGSQWGTPAGDRAARQWLETSGVPVQRHASPPDDDGVEFAANRVGLGLKNEICELQGSYRRHEEERERERRELGRARRVIITIYGHITLDSTPYQAWLRGAPMEQTVPPRLRFRRRRHPRRGALPIGESRRDLPRKR